MKCSQVKRKLSLLMDGRLEDEEAQQVRLHLEGCPGCRAEMKLMRISHESLASLGPAEVPEGLAEKSVTAAFAAVDSEKRIESADDTRSRSGGFLNIFLDFKWPAVVTSATAVAAAVVLGVASGFLGELSEGGDLEEGGMEDPVAQVLSLEEVGLEEELASDWVLGES